MGNAVRTAWAQGRSVINGWLAIPSAFSAEVMAQAGFDSLTVDLQHGVQDYASAIGCFQAMQAHGPVPMHGRCLSLHRDWRPLEPVAATAMAARAPRSTCSRASR